MLLGYGMLLKSAACRAEEKELLLGERRLSARDIAGTKQAMMWEGWGDIKGRLLIFLCYRFGSNKQKKLSWTL